MNRGDTFPILPEHLQQIAMLVSPSDIVSMAGVSFGWQRALCVPHFVSHVLVHHPTWPPWLCPFIQDNLLLGEEGLANWYNVLPVLEVASRGLDALRSLPGKTFLVQILVEYAIECILVPTPGCHDLAKDSSYWIRVLNCQLWAGARNKFGLMVKIWEKHIEDTTPLDVFFEWVSLEVDASRDFKEFLMDYCTSNQLDWNFMFQLTLKDPVFFPDACNLIDHLIEYPTTLKSNMVNVDSVCRILDHASTYDIDWSVHDAYRNGTRRSALRPEENWLWDKVLQGLTKLIRHMELAMYF